MSGFFPPIYGYLGTYMFAIESEYPKKFQWFSDGKYFPEKNPILLKCELKKKFTAPFVIYFIDIFSLQKLHFKVYK